MSIGIFTDKNCKPIDSDISEKIGPMKNMWESLVNFMTSHYKVKDELKYMYGQKYGWALRFEIKSKLFTALYPTENGFTVQVILSPEVIEKALHQKLTGNVQKAIDIAHPYTEGRWLFIPVTSDDDIECIKILLELKCLKFNELKCRP